MENKAIAKVLLVRINKEAKAVMVASNTCGRFVDSCDQEYDNAQFQRDCANDQFYEGDYELSNYEGTLEYLKTLHKIVKLKKSLKPIFG